MAATSLGYPLHGFLSGEPVAADARWLLRPHSVYAFLDPYDFGGAYPPPGQPDGRVVHGYAGAMACISGAARVAARDTLRFETGRRAAMVGAHEAVFLHASAKIAHVGR